jgi:N-acetylmuramoyl-L-alanine amidase
MKPQILAFILNPFWSLCHSHSWEIFCDSAVKKILGLVIFILIFTSSVVLAQQPSSVVSAQQHLVIVFPPPNYQTSTEKIFFLGTAPPTGQVLINGKPINRSHAGHFAPNFPLDLGQNLFTVSYQNQQLQIPVTRISTQPEPPQGLAFAQDYLMPATDIARLPGELICFSAIAPVGGSVSVNLGQQTVPLLPENQQVQLPLNSSVLNGQNQPNTVPSPGNYQGCTTITAPADLGQPLFQLTLHGQTITQSGKGKIQILSPAQLPVAQVIVDAGVARTGPSTDYSRLTPLPKGTKATVTGREGEWLRLDYGAWINSQETQILASTVPPRSMIRSVAYRPLPNATEILFPLQVPVPISVEQGDNFLTLTLYNTTAQTDIIRLDDNPLISRLDWQQIAPGQVKYTLILKKLQHWGYNIRYDDATLVLALRHPPTMEHRKHKPLAGIKILLDPGHGGKETGATGPTGYLEKDLNLVVSKLLRDQLTQRGATVVMTREEDDFLSLVERQNIIAQEEPAISLSIHHNSLPDDGEPQNIHGFASFWYNTQAHSLAAFMHNYTVENLGRPSYGVFWDNLALTRPAIAPSVLLELGFMSNPEEFEQIMDPKVQQKTVKILADGIVKWFESVQGA